MVFRPYADPKRAARGEQWYFTAAGVTVNLVDADQASHTLKIRNRHMKGIYLNTWAPSTLDGDLPLTDFSATGLTK
ncbi:hypothetical protein [Arthrobacter ulcerisalmonis]|nr:hypothetical protein [Arthrobacter ulcerisalmonis]